MALEPVNERPIIPQLYRPDAQGVSGWSISLVRQLTTVFQQYGYRINKGLTVEDLGSEGGNLAELDALNNFAQMLQVAGEPLVSSGSNANGHWTRFADGTMMQRTKRLTLTQTAANQCRATWTFPQAFSDTDYSLSITPLPETDAAEVDTFGSEAAPTVNNVSSVAAGELTASDVVVAIFRVDGTIDFDPGDEMFVSITAWGNWN